MAERFAYYGVAGNLIMYLTTVAGQPVAEAAKTVNSWNGVSSLALLVGAFLADSYLGRFKTTIISSTIFLMVSPLFPSLFLLFLPFFGLKNIKHAAYNPFLFVGIKAFIFHVGEHAFGAI